MMIKYYVLCPSCRVIYDLDFKDKNARGEGACPCCGHPDNFVGGGQMWCRFPKVDDYHEYPKVFLPEAYEGFAELWVERM